MKVRATRFPPPLWGRDRERGGDEERSAKLVPSQTRELRLTTLFVGFRQETDAARVLPLSLSLPHKGGGNDVAPLCSTADQQSLKCSRGRTGGNDTKHALGCTRGPAL